MKILNDQLFGILSEGISISCLFDTVTVIPVWCADSELLQTAFPNAHRKKELVTLISEFDREENDLSEIWGIPRITFSDRKFKSTLNINNVLVALLLKKLFGFNMMSSVAMFSKMDYTIFNRSDYQQNRK